MTKTIFITHAGRTPQGAFLGNLSDPSAADLGACVLGKLAREAGIPLESYAQVVMGNVVMAGQGQAPARQAALKAGLPNSVPASTINKVCGSGLKAIAIAAHDIALGCGDYALAGGMESMSRAPYALPKARSGYRLDMPHAELLDLLVYDGLWDASGQIHMGALADETAAELAISRAELDEFSAESYRRALAAQQSGAFAAEIVPVTIKSRKETRLIADDEGPRRVDFAKLPTLKPVFSASGVTTAGNASSLSDGAAAVLLAGEDGAAQAGLTPLARIVAYAEAAREPARFTLAPLLAIERALSRAKLSISDIDLFEINEAFAVVPLAAMRALKIPHEKVNVNGGAISLGHPLGASGARVLVTLIHALHARKARYGLAALCIGGGEAVAMIIERL